MQPPFPCHPPGAFVGITYTCTLRENPFFSKTMIFFIILVLVCLLRAEQARALGALNPEKTR